MFYEIPKYKSNVTSTEKLSCLIEFYFEFQRKLGLPGSDRYKSRHFEIFGTSYYFFIYFNANFYRLKAGLSGPNPDFWQP